MILIKHKRMCRVNLGLIDQDRFASRIQCVNVCPLINSVQPISNMKESVRLE